MAQPSAVTKERASDGTAIYREFPPVLHTPHFVVVEGMA